MKNIFILTILMFLGLSFNIPNAAAETLVVQPGPVDGKDTMYGTVYYTNGYPDAEFMYVGGWGDEYFSYLEFDLSLLPSDATITSADLWLYQDLEGRTYNEVKVLRITEDWTKSSVTKINNPVSVGSGTGWIPAPSVIGWWEADVLAVVKDWVAGTEPNYGFKLDGLYTDNNHARRYHTSDYVTDPTLRPKLVISYTLENEEQTRQDLIAELEKIVEDDITDVPMQNSYRAHVKKLLQLFEGGQSKAFGNQVVALLKKVAKDQQQGQIEVSLASEISDITGKLLN